MNVPKPRSAKADKKAVILHMQTQGVLLFLHLLTQTSTGAVGVVGVAGSVESDGQ
jgi:hypothetical protein